MIQSPRLDNCRLTRTGRFAEFRSYACPTRWFGCSDAKQHYNWQSHTRRLYLCLCLVSPGDSELARNTSPEGSIRIRAYFLAFDTGAARKGEAARRRLAPEETR
jgi:hypothetical protein